MILKIKEHKIKRSRRAPFSWGVGGLNGFSKASGRCGWRQQAPKVRDFLPAAVGENPDGFLTLSDHPIIAALVNAVKDIWSNVEDLLAW